VPVEKKNSKLNVLVVGGSQGAKGLNRCVIGAFSILSREERGEFAVTHITGEKDREEVTEQYRSLGLENDVHPFYRNMFELFQKTDLAVTRAGANTLFELVFYGIPAFVIPFPYAGGHQKLNAAAFADKGGLEYHDESPEAAGWLAAKLRAVLSGEKDLKAMAKAMKALAKPRAAEDLMTLSLELMKL
jgi:UDP-N-acetylglucosamine--N-acetylmuramyl-(pentapeptide) pyrophosphoryl-undecaprenol N-acetylglucosamine transferase